MLNVGDEIIWHRPDGRDERGHVGKAPRGLCFVNPDVSGVPMLIGDGFKYTLIDGGLKIAGTSPGDIARHILDDLVVELAEDDRANEYEVQASLQAFGRVLEFILDGTEVNGHVLAIQAFDQRRADLAET